MTAQIDNVKYDVQFLVLNDDVCGEYSLKHATIKVDRGMPKDVQRQTACHEVAHLWLRSLVRQSENEDEILADELGNKLLEFIRDNEQFCNWLREELEWRQV